MFSHLKNYIDPIKLLQDSNKNCRSSKNVNSSLQRSSQIDNCRFKALWVKVQQTISTNKKEISTNKDSFKILCIHISIDSKNWGTLLSTSIGSNANVPTPVDGNSIPDNRCLFPRISASAQHTQYCTKQGTMNECKEINLPILTQDESWIMIHLFINITLDCNCATVCW